MLQAATVHTRQLMSDRLGLVMTLMLKSSMNPASLLQAFYSASDCW
jgi:hypothetical protein